MDIQQLSGGEKTVASLALLFAIQSYKPQGKPSTPFFVMDEIDAALDKVNVQNVARYIHKRSRELQCIVISHNPILTRTADTLVGVYQNPQEPCSETLTLDLSQFPEQTQVTSQ